MTLNVNEQVAEFPELSKAVQVTVVTPTGKVDPEGGVQATVMPEQLSLAVGAGKLPVALVASAGAVVVWLAGQVIVGGCVSFTVTVN